MMVKETSVILILNNVNYIFVSKISYFYILWILNQIDDDITPYQNPHPVKCIYIYMSTLYDKNNVMQYI